MRLKSSVTYWSAVDVQRTYTKRADFACRVGETLEYGLPNLGLDLRNARRTLAL